MSEHSLLQESVPEPGSRTAVVLSCHTDNPRVIRHFERLRSEAGLPVFRVRHVTDEPWSPSTDRDIPLREEDLEASMPVRYAVRKEENRRISDGYGDLIYIAASLHPALKSFERLWILEYDVDFSGSWADFFSRYEGAGADLVSFRFQRPGDNPGWNHWKTLKTPVDVQPLGGLHCALRISKRLVRTYKREMESGAWAGHTEATVPTVASSLGLSIMDMGQSEFFRPDGREPVIDHDTFGYRPVRSTSYFHEEPANFAKPGMLYHPVKV